MTSNLPAFDPHLKCGQGYCSPSNHIKEDTPHTPTNIFKPDCEMSPVSLTGWYSAATQGWPLETNRLERLLKMKGKGSKRVIWRDLVVVKVKLKFSLECWILQEEHC